ncbi:MAG: metal-dependent phosphohydrolase [Cyanobacteria bacterium P01_H01_bin.121]
MPKSNAKRTLRHPLLQQHWPLLWQALKRPVPWELGQDLLSRYAEPHRSHHTLQHLEACLNWLQPISTHLQQPACVQLALWFHDAIYNPQRQDNEQRSADLAQQTLAEQRLPATLITTVTELILLTRQHQPPCAGCDAAYLCDIDLAILGAEPRVYTRYHQHIQQEYAWLSHDAFRAGRSRLLQTFLQRPNIYTTAFFQTHLEQQARQNLQHEYQQLTQQ